MVMITDMSENMKLPVVLIERLALEYRIDPFCFKLSFCLSLAGISTLFNISQGIGIFISRTSFQKSYTSLM